MKRLAWSRVLWVALAVLVAFQVAPGIATASATAAIYAYDAPSQHLVATPVGETRSALDGAAAERPARDSRGDPARPMLVFVAAESGADVVNAAGRAYPKVLDPRTGDPIAAPPSGLSRVPVGDRVPWGAQQRGAYIKDWYDQGYSTPEGGWSQYDIHHIIPREYGGTNDFNNLVPVLRTVHQQEFNPWWMNYGG